MNDRNHDGIKDGFDNFIEYHIYEDTSKNIIHSSDRRTKGYNSPQQSMSTLGAFLCIFSGLFWQALLFTLLNVDIEGLPSFVIIVLWIVLSKIATGLVNATRKK